MKSKIIPVLGSLSVAAVIAVGCNRPNSPTSGGSAAPTTQATAAATTKVSAKASASTALTVDAQKVRNFLTAPLTKIAYGDYSGMRYILGNGLAYQKSRNGIPRIVNLNGCALDVSKPSQKKLVDQIVSFMKDQPDSTFENFKQAFGQALLPQSANGLGFYKSGVQRNLDRSNFEAAREVLWAFENLKERYGDKLGQISAQDLQIELTTGGHMMAEEQ